MKMYFKVEGSNEIHVVNNLTGSITKEKVLEFFTKKYGKPCLEAKKKSVNLLTENGVTSVSFYVTKGEKITGKDLFENTEFSEGEVWYLGDISRNKADYASEIVYEHQINSDGDMDDALDMVYEELGLKAVLVEDNTVIIKG